MFPHEQILLLFGGCVAGAGFLSFTIRRQFCQPNESRLSLVISALRRELQEKSIGIAGGWDCRAGGRSTCGFPEWGKPWEEML